MQGRTSGCKKTYPPKVLSKLTGRKLIRNGLSSFTYIQSLRQSSHFVASQKFQDFFTNYVPNCIPKNVTTFSHYNSDIHESIRKIFGTNVTEKVGNQKKIIFHLT